MATIYYLLQDLLPANATDVEILELAREQGRVVLTQDLKVIFNYFSGD